ncbi:hypothetical protein HPB47_020974 [Ixodes persulcatus]|uniref:Uncharacterized protein n=1 Tax=Ixodes persulcatus TaxID=34615 RepID=A0AC60QE49_IXOPE|nr:hypothetical protein HPB47_020974 [Ixodes persulcatus]
MASGGGDTCGPGPSKEKRNAYFEEDFDSDMDTDVYLCSSSEEDSDYDVELSSSSDEAEDDDDPDRAIADTRQWSKIDMSSVPPAPPRSPFLGSPGKIFSVQSTTDVLEYFEAFLDNGLVSLIVRGTDRYAEQKLNASQLSEHSCLMKWVPTTTEDMRIFLSLLLLQGIVQKPEQEWYWSKNKLLHTPIFGEVMSGNRYQLIMRMLHFVDNESSTDLGTYPQPKLYNILPRAQLTK